MTHVPVDPTAARLPYDATLRGRHVELTRLEPGHARDLHDASHREGAEGLWTYLAEGPFANAEAFEHAIALKAVSLDPFYFAIRDLESGRIAGHCAFLRIFPEHRSIEVGNILYTPALQRSAGGTEAMYLLARHAFEDLGVRRYEWKCNVLNAPSYRAALRYGFTFEGVFRQHMIVKGCNRDTAWFSMLDSEWPARRASLEAWLAPGNFDEAGRQRSKLSML
ncbi:MAG: GCN5-related N-acetyltransferase [Hyphomicrobiales bacterium]|nr:GCN5-related N-acetyltransferase [Hyphomicrobiales bacterium]